MASSVIFFFFSFSFFKNYDFGKLEGGVSIKRKQFRLEILRHGIRFSHHDFVKFKELQARKIDAVCIKDNQF